MIIIETTNINTIGFSINANWWHNFLIDAALAHSRFHHQAHVALFSPVGAPRVFEDPVLEAEFIVFAPADNKNGVIDFGAASRVPEIAALIE